MTPDQEVLAASVVLWLLSVFYAYFLGRSLAEAKFYEQQRRNNVVAFVGRTRPRKRTPHIIDAEFTVINNTADEAVNG